VTNRDWINNEIFTSLIIHRGSIRKDLDVNRIISLIIEEGRM